MKTLKILLSAAFLSAGNLNAQQYTGDWTGNLDAGGILLPIIFHISESNQQYTATMDSPKQQAFGLKVKSVKASPEKIVLDMSDMGILYEGSMQADSLKGIFSQGGNIIELHLGKSTAVILPPKRPQEPKPKFSYNIEDVTFMNEKEQIEFAGTLTTPKGKGPFPAVILVSGSGPQNRDEELLGHKPFWIIADYLTKNGIAVLRYDDRGTAGSKGNFKTATSQDFAADAQSAIEFLRKQPKVDAKKIGVIGHSEGGMIAPMLAAKDDKIGFIVLLAGPGIPIESLMMKQTELGIRAAGASGQEVADAMKVNQRSYQILRNEPDPEKARKALMEIILSEVYDSTEAKQMIDVVLSPWFRYFIAYDPQPVLQQVKCPVLAINGDKDQQVTSKENLEGIRQSLEKGGNKNFKIYEAKDKNHLFQTSKTGLVSEYAMIEETFSPEILELMADWIKMNSKRVKK